MNKKTSIGDLVLLSLETAIDGYVRLHDYSYNSGAYFHGYDRPLNKTAISQALKRLREKGLIDFVNDDRLLVKITQAGRNRALLQKIYQKNQKWDGKWRLVSFDIPEKRRKARDLFRNHLKSWGFEPWQQSLWATRVDCADDLRLFIKQVGIEDWVVIIETSDVQ